MVLVVLFLARHGDAHFVDGVLVALAVLSAFMHIVEERALEPGLLRVCSCNNASKRSAFFLHRVCVLGSG